MYQVLISAALTCGLLVATGNSIADAPRNARIELLDLSSEHLASVIEIEPNRYGEKRVPSYLRAFGTMPRMIEPLDKVSRVMIDDGAVSPELKLAMGLRIADLHGAAYTAAHMRRLLLNSSEGRELLAAVESNQLTEIGEAERSALRYAEALTESVKGLDDRGFRMLRAEFNDSQVVELTLVVCYFNYFNRLVMALDLPVEEWITNVPTESLPSGTHAPPVSRVALISDAEAAAVVAAIEQARDPGSMLGRLGVGMPNSLRAMMRAPAHASAWMGVFRAANAESVVDAELKHWVSDTVSYLNECEYCISHQVHKLMNVGVKAETIAAARTSDDVLTEKQRLAVNFARAITNDPTSITEDDWVALRDAFGERGALEVLHEACAFNFMNRFTSGLRLPPEPEALKSVRAVEGW